MSLLSVDISKVKRLSLRDVKLPAPELRIEPTIFTERPPTDEDIAYSSLVAINPTLDILIDNLGLVNVITGDRPKRVEVKEITIPERKEEPEISPKLNLLDIAYKVIGEQNNLSKAKVINNIAQAINVSLERALNGFNLMLQDGVIERTNVDTYYLTGSTPF